MVNKKEILIDRKAFNFYKSYYDVFKQLNDKEKLEFIKELLAVNFIEKPIEDVNPKSFNLKLAFSAIKHSLESSIYGVFTKAKVDYNSYPWQGGGKGVSKGGDLQEKVEEKEKEKEKVEEKVTIPDFDTFLNYAKENKPKVCKEHLKTKYNAWLENDWKNGYDKPIKNWKSTLLNTLPHLKEGATNESQWANVI